jgi:hypothetical protein
MNFDECHFVRLYKFVNSILELLHKLVFAFVSISCSCHKKKFQVVLSYSTSTQLIGFRVEVD